MIVEYRVTAQCNARHSHHTNVPRLYGSATHFHITLCLPRLDVWWRDMQHFFWAYDVFISHLTESCLVKNLVLLRKVRRLLKDEFRQLTSVILSRIWTADDSPPLLVVFWWRRCTFSSDIHLAWEAFPVTLTEVSWLTMTSRTLPFDSLIGWWWKCPRSSTPSAD